MNIIGIACSYEFKQLLLCLQTVQYIKTLKIDLEKGNILRSKIIYYPELMSTLIRYYD